MQKTYFLGYITLVISFFPVFVMAQISDSEKLQQTTAERGLEALLDALDTRDGGNSDTVRRRGILASGSETKSVSLQIVNDDRVRKIYSSLNKMPQAKAAEIVSKSFNNSFSKLQKLAGKGKGDDSLSYGLHAKLWLSHQFETRANFNQHFRHWNDWYVERLVGEKYLAANKQVPAPIRKVAFAGSAGPELLMYLNLALTDQVKNGNVDKESEFARTLREAGLSAPLSQSYAMFDVSPFNAAQDSEKNQAIEPLLTIPLFLSWQGLDALDVEQRVELTSKVRNLIDKRSKLELELENIALSLLTLGGTVDLKGLQIKLQKLRPTNGTAIAFLGCSLKKPLVQAWHAEHPPNKKQLLQTVNRLVSLTPPHERDEWEANVEALKKWLLAIPESGIEAKKRKVFEWPEATAEKPENDEKFGPTQLRIRLVLKRTKAFAGEMKDKEDSQSIESPKGCE